MDAFWLVMRRCSNTACYEEASRNNPHLTRQSAQTAAETVAAECPGELITIFRAEQTVQARVEPNFTHTVLSEQPRQEN